MFGEVEITDAKLDEWVNAFGPDEKIPATLGHLADPENPIHTGEPAPCWISGLMKKGDTLFGNFVNWTPEGLEAITSGGYKNVSIESADGTRLTSVALLGARTPAVEFQNEKGRFAPLDMAGECMGEDTQIVLAQNLAAMGKPIYLPYKSPPKKITDIFEDEAGPKAWTNAFNAAYKEYDGDEAKANGTAWATVKEMGYTKGKDGIYRKKAATAAKGGLEMAENDAAKAADENVVLAWLKEKFGKGEKPEAATVLTAKHGTTEESPEMVAMAKRLDELEGKVKDQADELAMAGAMANARELCKDAHIAPSFEGPMAQYMAGKSEIVMAEPERDKDGNVTKEYKLSRNDFFAAVLTSKGTEKLDDPKKLTAPPAKKPVTPFMASGNKYMPEDPEEQAALAEEAKTLVRTEGKTIEEATAAVLAAWQKKQEA
jgi:cation transport regulator ChaB